MKYLITRDSGNEELPICLTDTRTKALAIATALRAQDEAEEGFETHTYDIVPLADPTREVYLEPAQYEYAKAYNNEPSARLIRMKEVLYDDIW